MIFQRLTLHNFGLYLGRQEIELAPPSPDKPVVLFGGLNGGGKTTFLNGLLLALYGKHAKVSNRAPVEAYETYLLKSINRQVPPTDGAALELTFTHFIDGHPEEIRICRCWRATKKSASESLEVFRDGQLDPFLAEHWDEYVEELIPSRLARLFFFDGEKIESLADPSSAAEFIRTGVHDLLGLGLVSTLITDLKVLERRIPAAAFPQEKVAAIEQQEKAISEHQHKRAKLVQHAGDLELRLHQLKDKEEVLRGEYRRLGGEQFEKRDGLQRDLERAEIEHFHVEDALRLEASGAAPLILIKNLLQDVFTQVERERRAKESQLVAEHLNRRDSKMMRRLVTWGLDSEISAKLSAFLEQDRGRLQEEEHLGQNVGLSDVDLGPASTEQLDESETRVRALLERFAQTEEAVARAQRQLASIPDPEGLEGISQRLAETEAELIRAEHERELLAQQIEVCSAQIEKQQMVLEKLREERVNAAFSEEKAALTLDAGDRCRRYLVAFRERLAQRNLKRVSRFILESFQQLLRKQSLIEDIEIDPNDYSLGLRDKTGALINTDGLSAGERQLLSISILWSLSRAAGRPIPLVVDTPLGRLDGQHRRHLTERYFPFAAHQVILLSTDEEIVGDLYDGIRAWVGREYTLRYQEDSSASQIDDGYDFRGAA